jgi:multiple sugar transport system ATP-binding protein
MAAVSFRGLSKAFKGRPALAAVDLDIRPQSFTVLCGPPKSGKSVLCRILVGLDTPDAGSVSVDGQDITRLSPAARPIGYVPQSFALYPHFTVAQNIAYALTLAGAPREDVARRVDRAAALLSITHLLKKMPDQLSGGEKQRTALARGLLKEAYLFVLDDPLVGLDYKLRERLMDDLKALRQDLGATFVYATSDSLEALTMAQDLVVLDGGCIVQHGDAVALYDDPRHLRSLELVGFPKANVIAGTLRGGTLEAGPLRVAAPGFRDGPVAVGLRPEALRRGRGAGLDGAGRVTLVEDLGGELVVYLDVDGTPLVMAYPVAGAEAPVAEAALHFTINPVDLLLFDAATGRRLPGFGGRAHG